MADRRVSVQIDADVSAYSRALSTAAIETKAFARELESADGRMANLIQTGLALAPAFVPLGAAAVPAVAGLTLQLGLAAGAAGVAALALHGTGDALKALDAYQLAPTAENFAKLNQALDKLGPAGQEFVLAIDKMKPQLQDLQDVAEAGLLPGLTDGLQDFIKLAPQVQGVLFNISSTLGDLARDGGKGLNSEGLKSFFDYIQRTARPVLTEMGQTFGNFVEGLANVIVAFDPLSRSFSTGLLNISRAFKDATSNLGDKAGFQDFVAYVQKAGPLAFDALKSIGNAFVQLVEAAAPVGSAVLPVVSALADALGGLANSPVGPILISTAAAIGVLGRSMALLKAVGLTGGASGQTGLIGRALGVDAIKAYPGIAREAAAATTALAEADKAAQIAHQEYLASLRVSSAGLEVAPGAGLGVARSEEAAKKLSAANGTQAAAAKKAATAEDEKTRALSAGSRQMVRNAALAGGLALASSGLSDSFGLANTASLALAGSFAGPIGAAVGGSVGLFLDAKASAEQLTDAMRQLGTVSVSGTIAQRAAALAAAQSANDAFYSANALIGGFKTLGALASGNDPGNDAAEIAKQQAALSNLTSTYRGLSDVLGQRLPPNASIEQIQAFADQVAPALQAAGIDINDVVKGGYDATVTASAAIQGYFTALDSATGKSQIVGSALADLGNEMETNVSQAKALSDALDNLFGVELSQSAATDAAIEALQRLGDALRKAKGFNLTDTSANAAPEVLAARDAIRSYVSAQNDKVKADAAADGSGRRAAQTLIDTRNNIIATAKAAGASKDEIHALVRQMGLTPANLRTIIQTPGLLTANQQVKALARLLGLTPAQVRTRFHLDGADPALGKVSDLQQRLNDIEGIYSATIKISTTGSAEGPAAYANTPRKKKATGGRISGPGGPTEDRIPAWLSNGEYVVRAAAVQQVGVPFLDHINAQGYADGGFTGTDYIAGYNTLSANLDILQQQQQIRQLENDLNQKVKKGKRKGQYVIFGADRDEKQAELDKANLDLYYLQHKAELDATAAQAQADQDAAAARDATSSSLFGTLDLTARGTSASSIAATVARFKADVSNYSTSLQALINAGAGYGILQNVQAIANTGDFRTAAKVAQSLASDPLILGSINSDLTQVQMYTTGIGTTVNGASFQNANTGVLGGATVNNNFYTDPNWLLQQVQQVVTHTLDARFAQAVP